MSLSGRNAIARQALDREREWQSILRYVRLWTEPTFQYTSTSVEKFKSIQPPCSGPILVVTGIEPYTYSLLESNNEIQFPHMIGVLSFSSRNKLQQCLNQTIETFRHKTSRLDVVVESQVSVNDNKETRCIMIAYEKPF